CFSLHLFATARGEHFSDLEQAASLAVYDELEGFDQEQLKQIQKDLFGSVAAYEKLNEKLKKKAADKFNANLEKLRTTSQLPPFVLTPSRYPILRRIMDHLEIRKFRLSNKE